MESEDTRTLKIEIPPCNLVSADGMGWTDLSGLNGWTLLQSNPNMVSWEGTIDLSGYAREMKTFYPLAGIIQEGPYWIAFNGSGQTSTTIISTIPLDADEVALQIGLNGGPGFLNSQFPGVTIGQQNWETVLFSETQINLINSTLPALGICQPITNKQSGSLSPTASDTLYCMKIVGPWLLDDVIGDSLSIPASRVIIPGKFGIEPDVEYMMRLKRSVELSQQA
jgi:hypothetical protein